MYVSIKIWDDDNAESGRIEMYNRSSFTCTVLMGTLAFSDKEEKTALLKILTWQQPEIEIIPNDMTTGVFTEVYFK
jgi:hypothetical protein